MSWIVLLIVVVGAAAIAAAVTWLIVRRRRRETAGAAPAETLDGDPTPVPAVPATGPTWSAVVDRIPLGVVVMGASGPVLYRNANAKAMAGTYTGLLIDDAVQAALRRALTGERSRELLELYGPPQAAVVVTAEGLPGGSAVATIEDVSERRRVDAMRTDFVANISHELKTPVGALAVLAEALTDEQDADVVRRVSERMVAEAHRVARTIDDLMELSRIELGEESVRDTVDVLDIVSGAIDRSAALAEARGMHIAVLDLPDRVAVVGDRRQLISALGNLVENAVKYSEPEGQVQIRVRVEGNFAELMVADQGIGIPACRSRPHLRALLPGRQGAQPGHRRHRPRPGHRSPRRHQPRWRGACLVRRGRGLDIRDPPSARPPSLVATASRGIRDEVRGAAPETK